MGILDRPIEIELDRVRHVRLDLNALVAFEERTGKPLSGAMSLRELREFLYVCLLDCASGDPGKACSCPPDPEFRPETVGRYLTVDRLEEIGELVQRVLDRHGPAEEADHPLAVNGAEQTADRTGRRSGR